LSIVFGCPLIYGFRLPPIGIFKLFWYIVGATADVTVLQQTYNGQLKELYKVTGDDCGGTSVDGRLCKMLEEIVGGNVISKVKRKDPADWLQMLQDFRRKMKYLTTSNTKVTTLKFPLSLNEICEELHGKDFKSAIKSSSYVSEITLVSNKIRFKADLMIKLLTPTIDSIITLMKNTVSNRATNGVSHIVSNIVMVGGLSECPIIQDGVYKAYPDTQIIIPVNANFAVFRPDYSRSELCDEEGIGK
jgi:molecular chaperone DnaK (HSP70)